MLSAKKDDEDTEKFFIDDGVCAAKMTGHCVDCNYRIKASRYWVKDKYTDEGGVIPKINSCAQMDLPLQDK